MIRISSALFLLLLVGRQAEAQGLSPAVKYGKWVLLAGSIGMHALAVRAHDRADNVFDALEAQCADVRARCELGPDGAYADPAIESLYQSSLRYDRRARGWLIGGEAALAGSAVLFIWELTRPKTRPDNIPFEPEVRTMSTGRTGIGLKMAF